jgi:hypothetical protein
MKIFFFFVLSICTCSLQAQQFRFVFEGQEGMPLNEKKFSKWIVKNPSNYNGVYHFGESEWEWDLIVFATDTSLVLQGRPGTWGRDENGRESWVMNCQTANNCRLTGHQFTSDHFSGYFMKYTEGQPAYGIVLLSENGKMDTVEFGGRNQTKLVEYFDGQFPELSAKILDDKYFAAKTRDQLQLMRNEIFARYGMKFTKGGKMHTHFTKSNWYRPTKNSVEECLTLVEKRNLEKILAFEKAISDQAIQHD